MWKERNKRVFEGKIMTALLVFNCIMKELGPWQMVECIERHVVPVLVLFLVEYECFL